MIYTPFRPLVLLASELSYWPHFRDISKVNCNAEVNPVYHPMIRYGQQCLAAHSLVLRLIGERDIYQCVQINDVH